MEYITDDILYGVNRSMDAVSIVIMHWIREDNRAHRRELLEEHIRHRLDIIHFWALNDIIYTIENAGGSTAIAAMDMRMVSARLDGKIVGMCCEDRSILRLQQETDGSYELHCEKIMA